MSKDKRPTWVDMLGKTLLVAKSKPASSVIQLGAPPQIEEVRVCAVYGDYVQLTHNGSSDQWYLQEAAPTVVEILDISKIEYPTKSMPHEDCSPEPSPGVEAPPPKPRSDSSASV